MRRVVAAGIFGALVSLVSLRARAAGPADQAAADALFQEGKKLFAAGDYEHACPKLAESNRLDPGAGTLLNLGNCYEKLGKLASAWATFNAAGELARNAGDTPRAAEAAKRAEALTPMLSRLTVVVPPAARVPGLEVRRDGTPIGEGQWGSSVPIDPGDHIVEATAPGRASWQRHISPNGSESVTVPTLGSAAAAAAPKPTAAASVDNAPPATKGFWTPRRTAAAVVGAGGVVGLVVGGTLGGLALQKNSASKADCSPTNTNSCNADGTSLRSTAISLGNGSTAGLVIGGALVVTSVVLFAVAPSPSTSVEVVGSPTAWALRTRF